jgi:hypothetical protein
MTQARNGVPRSAWIVSLLCSCGTAVLILLMASCTPSRRSDFHAYYTRLDYDDHDNTGRYADLIAKIGTKGRFVFCREFGYLPYWQPAETKYFVDRILPVTGDGPPERPDKINKCSYVRLIEGSPDRIVVHWRYAPDLDSPHFTDFQRTYSGDIGSYFADYAEEYFTITPDGRITREAKKGCLRLDEWNDPLNKTTQVLELTSSGIKVLSTTPARLRRRPGDAVPGAPVVKGGVESPALWMRFDEGLSAQDDITTESVKGSKCRIGGADSHWRKGVSGACLSFDGYTNRVTVPSRGLPTIRGDFTIEAWIAPQEYSWNWSGIVDHSRMMTSDAEWMYFKDPWNEAGIVDRSRGKRAGYRLGMDHLGRISIEACLDGRWEGLTTSKAVDLLKWTFVTATYRKAKGFAIHLDGVLAASGSAKGAVQDAPDPDLFIGMAHEKSYPWACEREITKTFRSNMVFSGLIDEVRVFDRALSESEIRADYRTFQPDVTTPLSHWALPAGPMNAKGFGAAYTKLPFSPEWDGLWRVGDHADIVVSFDDRPNRFVFWRGTNYLPSLVTEPGPKGIWVNDQGPENYTDQCYEHMSDKMCRYSHVRLIENTEARVVVHWRNASVSIGYEWLWPDADGWGLWTDEYWTIYPDAVSVRHQVSGRMAEFPDTQSQQNELLNQPGTRPEDNVVPGSITVANTDGQTELWDYSSSRAVRRGASISGEKNLVYLNLRSKYKHFNIGQAGSFWVPYSQWESMRLAPGFSSYNAWSHYPVGLLPSDGTVATGRDRTSSSCLGTLNGLQHRLKDGRMEAYNIYGLTDLPAADLTALNRSWNSPPAIVDLNGGRSTGCDQRQKAYLLTRESERLSFGLNGSAESPVLNPCFVIRGWGGPSPARLKIDGRAQVPGPDFRQGIIRDTDGTETMVIWVRQRSDQPLKYEIY